MADKDKFRYTDAMAIFRRGLVHSLLLIRAFVFFMVLAAALMPEKARADVESAIQAFNNGQQEAAIAELSSLAKAGSTQAKYVLGVIYAEGRGGITPNLEAALKWFREAADEGNSNAQYGLGILHAAGKGVPKDLVRGLMWLNIALTDQSTHPAFRLQVVSMTAALKKSMTPEQIAEANKLAAAWKPGAGEQ